MEGQKLRFNVLVGLLLAVFILKAQIIHWPRVEGMEMAGRQKLEFQCQNRTDTDSTISSKLTKRKLKQLKLAIKRNPLEIWFFKNLKFVFF